MTVTSELATVYRGGGRRWFTLQAACNAEAAKLHRERFKSRCECSEAEDDYWGAPAETCMFHEAKFLVKFRRRVARLVMKDVKEKDMA